MQNLTKDQIAQLSFDNSLVTAMNVNPAEKSVTITLDRAFLDNLDEAVEIHGVVLSVSGYEDVVARIYNDEEFVTVDAADEAHFFAELCEFTHEGSKTMISGFSTQEGSWSDYTFEGGVFTVAHR